MGREGETEVKMRKAYVQRECKAIGREFARAEKDGLENRDSG
jgi:hypothetical protein